MSVNGRKRCTLLRWFLGLLLLGFVFPTGCSEPKGNQKLTVEKTDDVLMNDIVIATFPTPEGWTPNRSGGNTAVILTPVDANPENPEEMISVDVGKPVSPEVEASAKGLAAKFSGTVTPLPSQIDGEPAYRVSVPPSYEQIMPRECIVVHHAGQVCFLFGASKTTADIWPALSAVAQSWKWK